MLFRSLENLSGMAFDAKNNGITPILGTNLNVCAETIDAFFKSIVDTNTANPTIIKHRELLERFCKANYMAYIDFNAILTQASSFPDMRDFIFDGLHPNKIGHEILAKAVASLPLFN